MMRKLPSVIIHTSVVCLAACSSSSVFAQGPWSLSANIGVVSNYMWRGMTQTDDQAAIQGGLDANHASGFYAGTWVSNVDFGAGGANYELDLYTGYNIPFADDNARLGFNLGYYAYPDSNAEIDFSEISITGGYGYFSAGIYYTIWGDDDNEDTLFDSGDLYYGANVDIPLPQGFGIGLFTGYYDFRHDDVTVDIDALGRPVIKSADYWHWGLNISKDAGDFGTFALNYDQNGGKDEVYDDDPKLWVSWSKEF
jgi:uncharacterized protein (TIGR02001 family)